MSKYDRGEFKGIEEMEAQDAAAPPPPPMLATPADANINIQWLDGSQGIVVLSMKDTLADLWGIIEHRTGIEREGLELFLRGPQIAFGEDGLRSTISQLGLNNSNLGVRKRTELSIFRSPRTLENLSMLAVIPSIVASKLPEDMVLPTRIAQGIIAILAHKKQLKLHHLKYFVNCYLTSLTLDGIKDIAGNLHSLMEHTHLKWLSLQNMPFIINEDIDCLIGFKNLTCLNLGGNISINDDAMPSITKITKLETLILSGTRITDHGVEILCNSSPPDLSDLNLSRTAITDQAMEHLYLISKLKCLNLAGCYLSSMEGLGKVTSLIHLSLARTNITVVGMERLKTLVNLKTLHLGSITSNRADEAFSHLQDLHLNELSISNKTGLTDIGISHLIKMPLESLDLSFCALITNAGMKFVGKIKSLKKLNLLLTRISDDGLRHLTGLEDLTEICLSRCHITDDGAANLTSHPRLQILDLSYTDITSLLLQRRHLNECKYLKRLNLKGTQVRSQGFQSLVLPYLSWLNVEETNIHPNSLPDLSGCPLVEVIYGV